MVPARETNGRRLSRLTQIRGAVGAAPLLLIALGISFVAVPLARGEIFYYWDNAQQHFPQTVYLKQSLQAGYLPHWWPAVGNGAPAAAEGQAAHYQPIHLVLTWLFSPATSLMLEIGVYLVAAGLGTYFFLRSFRLHRIACFVGATCLMFGSFSMVFIRNMGLWRSFGFLPLTMLCAEKYVSRGHPGWLCGVALLTGLQLLSGHPTLTIVTLITATFYVGCRLLQTPRHLPATTRILSGIGRLASWSAAVLIGFAVAAIQLWPQFLHIDQSIRQGGLSPDYASSLPAMLRYAPQLVLPYAYLQGDWSPTISSWAGSMNQTPSSGLYLGAVAVFLPVCAVWWHRRGRDPMWALAAGLALSAGLALGANTPLFPALRSLPGLGGLRYPSRFLMAAEFMLACLAAFGLHRILARGRLGAVRFRDALPLLMVGAGVLALAAVFWTNETAISAAVRLSPGFRAGIVTSVLLLGIAGVLAWSLLKAGPRSGTAVAVVLAAFSVTDLHAFRAHSGYAPAFSLHSALEPPPVARVLSQDPEQFRVMSLVPTEAGLNRNEDLSEFMQANVTTLWGIDSADVWYSLFLKRHYAVKESIAWELAHNPEAAGKLATFLASWNVKFVVAPAASELRGWTRVHQSARATTWRNPHSMARAFLVSEVVPERIEVRPEWASRSIERLQRYHGMAKDWAGRVADSQIVDHLLAGAIDFRRTAVVEGPDLPAVEAGNGSGEVTPLEAGPDELDYQVRVDRRTLLVISTNFYPGWRAMIDGRPAKIWRVNYTSMGVAVPAGDHAVRLEFATPGFDAGAAVSASASALCFAGIVWFANRRRAKSRRQELRA